MAAYDIDPAAALRLRTTDRHFNNTVNLHIKAGIQIPADVWLALTIGKYDSTHGNSAQCIFPQHIIR